MPKLSSPAGVLAYAKANNWLALSASEGNVLTVFLTPAGNMVEIYFEKNKMTLKALTVFVGK
ncbi:MAG: hypothetical protein JW901_10805 [Dehalococcoidia bacterium]|nr:hypothetical protein [Dehalococcoidia bacterium]